MGPKTDSNLLRLSDRARKKSLAERGDMMMRELIWALPSPGRSRAKSKTSSEMECEIRTIFTYSISRSGESSMGGATRPGLFSGESVIEHYSREMKCVTRQLKDSLSCLVDEIEFPRRGFLLSR